jgi:peroxiredoxin family protein
MTSVIEVAAPAAGGRATINKMSIVMFSGTADKFIPLGVLAQAAAAMDMEVEIFVTGFALRAFTKGHPDMPFPAEFADMAPALAVTIQVLKRRGGRVASTGCR